ncbi:MAG: phospholipid/cholesterol/gamma-HCH transport system substrate-binding protein [Solirubrobacterales bacterium]|jgi:ABC-type transporter Mla subunit MlaD|nr:phospholipid/cholesterol/gamma-HCH transport system substrate-binding protein [Solirubrobacterales bacterium]
MRRALVIGALVAAVIVAIVLISSGGSGGNDYVVRAIFDSGGFMVKGEQVRVAGANVGEIESVGVTLPGEIDSYENGKEQALDGKAVIVMNITDAGFQDFRSDASCQIRPQSLIGEKFVDCRPTLPRAPGSQPAPPLKEIPEDQPGAGQLLLPLENNSTSVDPDLINDINKLPYAQRFRLIFNELGAGLAGRGEDIEAVVKRANPALRDVDRLLGILDAQRDQLTRLAADSEQILEPLSRERAHVAGFFTNSGAAAQATTERGEDLEASLQKFPAFLREFRLTMRSLQGFSDAATPTFAALGKAAPGFTEATRLLTPFSAASTVALKSLGTTGEEAGPTLRAADPIVRKTTALARTGVSPTTNLAKFLASTEETKGFDGLVDLIYNTTAATNGFDQYGHFTRILVTLTNCLEYGLEESGCSAQFTGTNAGDSSVSTAQLYRLLQEEQAREAGEAGGTLALPKAPGAGLAPSTPLTREAPEIAQGRQLEGKSALAGPRQRALLDYLLGP